MDTFISCATGGCGVTRRSPSSGRVPAKYRKRAADLPPQSGEVCLAHWLVKSPRDKADDATGGWPLLDRLRPTKLKPQWRRRFFVLTKSQAAANHETGIHCPYQLYYYADSQRTRPRGAISMATVRRVEHLTPPPIRLAASLSREIRVRLQQQRTFVSFECQEAHVDEPVRWRHFYLLADSSEVMQVWVQLLTSICDSRFRLIDSSTSVDSGAQTASPLLEHRNQSLRCELSAPPLGEQLDGGARETATGSRPDSGFHGGGCGSSSAESLRVGEVSIVASSNNYLTKPNMSQAATHYARLDLEAIKQPRSPGPPPAASGPAAAPHSLIRYMELDRDRTQALAEIGADITKRLKIYPHRQAD